MKRSMQSFARKVGVLFLSLLSISIVHAEIDNVSLPIFVGAGVAGLEGRILDGRTGDLLYSVNYGDNGSFSAREVKWSPCGRYYAIGGNDSDDLISMAPVTSTLRVLEIKDNHIIRAASTPGVGNEAVGRSSVPPGINEVARIDTGEAVQTVSWSPDSKFLATGQASQWGG